MTRVVFIGGPHDGKRGEIRHTPDRVVLGRAGGSMATYERIDDPDTGEFLGGYAWVNPEAVDVWTSNRGGAGYLLGKARP